MSKDKVSESIAEWKTEPFEPGIDGLEGRSGRFGSKQREYFRVKSSASEQEFSNFFSKFGFANAPISISEYFWLDTSTEPTAAKLLKASKRLRIKRKNNRYWLQYKIPVLPCPSNDFLFKTFEEQKCQLKRQVARKIVSQGYALATEFPDSCDLVFRRFEVFATSISERRKIRKRDLEIMVEQFQKSGEACRHYQLEFRSSNPVSVQRFRTLLEQEIDIRKPASKLSYIWKDGFEETALPLGSFS